MRTVGFYVPASVKASSGPATYQGLTIPVERPRLFWNPSTLLQARLYFASHPFTPLASDQLGNAVRYLMTGEVQYAQVAINALMDFTISDAELNGNGSDHYRTEGEWCLCVFDWCYDQMTADQRATIIQRWDYYASLQEKPGIWPNAPLWANNYVTGRWRNAILRAVAFYHESTVNAQASLDYAFGDRWTQTIAWANGPGKGGVCQEGSTYGQSQITDAVTTCITCKNLGRNIYAENPFYHDAMLWLIHHSSNGPIANRDGSKQFWQVYTWGDDEQSWGYPAADGSRQLQTNKAIAGRQHFASMCLRVDPGLAPFVRQWMNNVDNGVEKWHLKASEPQVTPQDYKQSFPLDYFSPGCGFLHCKSSWDAGAFEAMFQMGPYTGAGHLHHDQGTLQIRMGGRWLTHESCGYSNWYVGIGGTGQVKYDDHAPHNSLCLDGKSLDIAFTKGPAIVTPPTLAADYATVSTDLTLMYRSQRADTDNPNLVSLVRDFVFIRPLDCLLSVYRVATVNGLNGVWFLHFENVPTISGNVAIGTNGNMQLRCECLIPAGQSPPTNFVTDEKPATGTSQSVFYQQRLEQTFTGPTQAYLMHVLQGRSAGGSDLAATMTEDAATFTVTLAHPTKGTRTVMIPKGMATGAYSVLGA